MNEELINDSLVQTIDNDMSSGSVLIDSTQNAIVGAAQNVSHAIDAAGKAALEHNISESPFYLEVHFWIGVAFVLSVLILLKPAYKFICNALKKRIQGVIDDINEAVGLRDEAQKLLADYERKFVNVKQEVQGIIEQGQKQLNNFKKSETAKLQEEMRYKEKETSRRIEESLMKAKQEINASVGERSVALAQKAIEKYIKNDDKSKFIDDAINDLDKFIK